MAEADFLSGWIAPPAGGVKYQLHLVVTESDQTVDTNTSTLNWELLIEKDQSHVGFLPTNASWSVTLNGVVVGSQSGVAAPIDTWDDTDAASVASSDDFGTLDVVHAADGSKTITVAAQYNGGNTTDKIGLVQITGQTMDLDTLDLSTEPAVSTSPAVVGDSVTIDLSTASDPSYTHDITYEAGALTGTIATGVPGTASAATWTVPDVSGQYSGFDDDFDGVYPIGITITTKSGGVSIGSNLFTLLTRTSPLPTPVGDHSSLKQFDIRARMVEWNNTASAWEQTTILPASILTMVEVASGTTTLTLKLNETVPGGIIPEWSVVDVEVWDPAADSGDGAWIFTNHRFVLTRIEDDQIDSTKANSYSGIEYVDFMMQFSYVQKEHVWKGTKTIAATKKKPVGSKPRTTPGDILDYFMTTSKARHWGPRMAWSFSKTKTSLGERWKNTRVDRDVTAGTPISQLLSGFVDDGVAEYRATYNFTNSQARLVLMNPGTGRDFTTTGSNPVVNLALLQLDSAPRRGSVEQRVTRVTVVGEDKVKVTRSKASFDTHVFGALEGWVQASGIKSNVTASRIAKQSLIDSGSAVQERTFVFKSAVVTRSFFPFLIYRAGDWVLIPNGKNNDSNTHNAVKDRISQITVDKQIDGTTITILTGQRILSGTAAIAKKQAASTGGASSGGTGGSISPIDTKTPAPVLAPYIQGLGYWDSDGAAKSAVTLTWSPVTKDTTGAAIKVGSYEVWSRPHGIGASYALLASTDELTINVGGYDVLEDLDFRVRAVSSANVVGDFSPDQEFVTLAPPVDLDGPGFSNLYTDGVGNLFAVWDGTLNGLPAPKRLAYVVAEESTDGGVTFFPAGTPITAAGTIVLGTNGVWGDYTVRLRGYDRLGNAGYVSDPLTITISDPHIDSPSPLPPTNIIATAGSGWGVSGFLPEAWFDLTWDVPTLDVSGNSVDIVGYDIFGLKSTETIERYLTSSPTNAVRIPVANGETWSFTVKATSVYGGVSAASDGLTAVANAALPGAAIPATPTLAQYLGLLRVLWGGGGMSNQIDYVYATISSTVSGTYVRAGATINGAGEIAIPGLAPGTYYAKVTMVDAQGNSVTSAASAPITLLPPTGVTIQTSALANTGIKLTNSAFTAYKADGSTSFLINAVTGEVTIAAYAAVFNLGASGTSASTGAAVTGLQVSAQASSFNTFIHPSGVQIRRDQTPLSWWEADTTDSSLVNFFAPRAVIRDRFRTGDYEFLTELKTTGSRLVIRYKGA